MQAVFFEMRPHPGHLAHYFDNVARLRPVLTRHPGLAFLDRYASVVDPDDLLSHQLWESEAAITSWRADAEHRKSQAAGRQVHFADYRIRVGERIWHWQAGSTDVSASKALTPDRQHVIALYGRYPIEAPSFTTFESVNHPGQFITLATAEGSAPVLGALAEHMGAPGLEAAAVYSIARDYGQFDRAESPG